MLTGRAPGADPSTTIPPRALRAGVPRDLDTVVRQAMAIDPDQRFQTVQAMAAALSRSASGADSLPSGEFLPVPPAPTGPEVTPSRGFLRHEGRLLGWVLALVAVAAVLVAVGLTLAKNDLGNLFGEDPPGSTRGPQTTTAATAPIRGVTGSAYDPLGDGGEHDGEAGNAVDGNPSTSWETDRYKSAGRGPPAQPDPHRGRRRLRRLRHRRRRHPRPVRRGQRLDRAPHPAGRGRQAQREAVR